MSASDGDQFDLNPFDYDIVTEAVRLIPELVAAASDPDAEQTVFVPMIGRSVGSSPISRSQAVA